MFGRKKIEPTKVDDRVYLEPKDVEGVDKIAAMEERRQEMAIELCRRLLVPTDHMEQGWLVAKEKNSSHVSFMTSVGGGHRFEIKEGLEFFEVKLWDLDWNGPILLRVCFPQPRIKFGGTEDPSEGYKTVYALVAAIKRQPDYLEDRFKQITDWMDGKEPQPNPDDVPQDEE